MSTLAKFGLWQEAQEPPSKPGQTGSKPPSEGDETRGNTGSNHVSHENRLFSSSHTHARKEREHTHMRDAHARTGHDENMDYLVYPVSPSESAGARVVSKSAPPVYPVSPPAFGPPAGSLQARLVAVGATVNTHGKRASVRAPDGIPLELVREVEARGWAIIPGGRANPEAEHDSWLAGVPIRELER